MHQVFVNKITENGDGSKTGYVVLDETIVEDLIILYDEKVQRGITLLIQNPPHDDGFYFFTRFHQFIVLFQWSTKLGASIKLSDYDNNLDNALDDYLKLSEKQWTLEDRNKIMTIFEEIRNDGSGEKAEMSIK